MFKNPISGITEKASVFIGGAKSASTEYIEKHKSEITTSVISKLHDLSTEHLQDRVILTKVFQSVHDLFPLPVRLFLSEETFQNFCFSNMENFHKALTEYKATDESERLPVAEPTVIASQSLPSTTGENPS